MNSKDISHLNAITQFQIAVEWIQKCDNAECFDMYDDFIRNRSEGQMTKLFTPSIVIAYAYMCFVLPRQSVFDGMDFNNVDISNFNIKVDTYAKKGKVCRHLRNALAHSNIEILKYGVKFVDNGYKTGETFEAFVSFSDLGRFISSIYIKNKCAAFAQGLGNSNGK